MLEQAHDTLVVGARGFVGKALVSELLKNNTSLSLVSRQEIPDFPQAVKIYGDLDDRTFCQKALTGITTVYYVAAYKKNISFHTKEPFGTILKNTRPFLNFLEAAKESGVKNIVYISSTNAEYALDRAEEIDGYVYGKYINEMLARAFIAETNIQLKVVRSGPVYGPGDNFNPKTANFIPALIHRTDLAEGEISIWGTGERRLQFIYIDDLVKNIIAAAASRDSFFVVGNPQVVSVQEVTEKIIGLIGKKLKISHDRGKPDKPTKLVEFKNLVEPEINIDAGLQKTLEYYRGHHA